MSHWDEGPRPPDAPRTRPRHSDPARGIGAAAPTPPRGTQAKPPDSAAARVPTADAEEDLVIRPFLLTGGRTQAAVQGLAVESLVQAEPGGASTDSLRFEARRIVEICWQPTSVAELAAALRVPLGVVRVLVSDLVAAGRVSVVRREQLSIQMMERIRDRVRAL